jgi:hypothetical protein
MIDDDDLRLRLKALLDSGLEPESQTRAFTSDEVRKLVTRLQTLAPEDYELKLKIAGFTLTPYAKPGRPQACETCMYYVVRRRFCELPELRLPVEPQWSCRLWRI